ncbi:hypothetical protein [Alloyangia pacifica]|nr:hypothetical protein [Alloyangia pacifica]
MSQSDARLADGASAAPMSGLSETGRPFRDPPTPERPSAPRLSIGQIDVIFEAPKPAPQPIPPRSRPQPPRSRGFDGFAARRLGLRR